MTDRQASLWNVVVLITWMSLALPTVLGSDTRPGERTDDALVRQLVGRNQTIRSQTLTRLESDRHLAVDSLPSLVSASEILARDAAKHDSVDIEMVRLIQLIGTINDDLSEQALVQLLPSPNLGLAMIAAETLGKNKFQTAIDYLKKQVDRPEYENSYAFRFNLIRALVQMEHPDAIEFITTLSQSLDGQLKYKIDQAMADVTPDDFRGDQPRFDAWTNGRSQKRATGSTQNLTTGSIFKPGADEPESLQRIRLAKQQYYGIEIHAKRLMFIIDHSGSMQEYDGGQTRLDRAKSELMRVIESLPPETEFAIVFYDTRIARWRDELVEATDKNKQQATQLIRGLKPGDSTNTYGALRTALEFDDSLEAVFLLTDGRPTAGDIIHPNLIVEDILHRNRFRHLNFNTIGIALSRPTEQFLKTLAEESGGEFRSAN